MKHRIDNASKGSSIEVMARNAMKDQKGDLDRWGNEGGMGG